jgi:hypothetical protein
MYLDISSGVGLYEVQKLFVIKIRLNKIRSKIKTQMLQTFK